MQESFKILDYASNTTDITFQQSSRPSRNMAEEKMVSSERHNLHDYQKELSVLPIGSCMGSAKPYLGSLSDLEIFWLSSSLHIGVPKKAVRHLELLDEGLLPEMQTDHWGIWAHNGFQVKTESLQFIHFTKGLSKLTAVSK